jgi:hypothetical protein
MAVVTKKYSEAVKIFADLKGKKPLEVYSRLADKGYTWNSFDGTWESEASKSELPVINLNIKCQNALIDDAIELVREALKEYGLDVIKESRPYPAKQMNEKTKKYEESPSHSNAYIQILYPDSGSEDIDSSFDDSDA